MLFCFLKIKKKLPVLVNIVDVIKVSMPDIGSPLILASKSTSSELEVEQIGASVAPAGHVLFPFRVHKTRQVTL